MIEMMKIVEHKNIANDVFEIVLQGELVKEMKEPGQFVHVLVSDSPVPLLRRPISICEIDKEKHQFTMIYRIEGEGTRILSKRKVGESLDVMGPIGSGFPVEATKAGETALLVGGGIGTPPLYELSKQLVAKGVKVVHVLGFGSASDVFYKEEFAKLGDTHIATADGTEGTKGFVTDVIEQAGLAFDVLYSCGPAPMLRALEEANQGRRGFISMEERMACGIGACFACVCRKQSDPTGASYKKVCVDGPVFPLGEVVV